MQVLKESNYDRRNLSDAVISYTDCDGCGSLIQVLSKCAGFPTHLHYARSGWQPSLVHLRWVKYADLLITKSRDGQELTESKGVGVSLNFNMFEHFNGDMDAFAKHARENNARVTGPTDQPWNVREVTVLDPDGYKLVFMVPINLSLSFDEVIERASRSESNG
jgi:hypothetical protein